MNFKKYVSIVSVLLALLLVTQIPVPVLAETNWQQSTTAEAQSYHYDAQDEEYDPADILGEIEEKRTQNTKYFSLGGGKYIAAQYAYPVHYQDAGGDWQQYDNSLSVVDPTVPDDQQEYENQHSDQQVKLAKKAKKNNMVSVGSGEHSLSWGYADANKSPAELTAAQDAPADDPTVLEHINQEVWYRGLYTDTDLQVIVTPRGVKENIVLNSEDAPGSFTIQYKANGLTPVQQDPQTILLQNAAGQTVYTIAAPVMSDAAQAVSDALTLALTVKNSNHFSITLTADSTWLQDDDREYPVTIDPYVQSVQSTNNIETASVFSVATPSGYPYGTLYVGRSTVYNRMASLVKTDLPALSPGDVVIQAYMGMYQRDFSGTGNVQVNVSKVTESWTQDGLIASQSSAGMYGSRPEDNSKAEDYVMASASTTGKWSNWNITGIVKDWYNGEANNGVLFCMPEDNSYKCVMYVRADDYGDYTSSGFPQLTVYYWNSNGVEPYTSTTDFAFSPRGTGYINNYTGNMVLVENLFHLDSERLPMDLNLVYNATNYENRHYYTTDGKGASTGYGFMLDFQQRLVEITDPALLNQGYDYLYIDGDGTEHYFKQEQGSTTKWIDEEGQGMTLEPTSSGNFITFKDGSELCFGYSENGGYLWHKKDIYGNKINYRTSTPCGEQYGRATTKIWDSTSREVNLTYEVKNGVMRLKSMTDNEGRSYTFSYHTSHPHLLWSISYPDGTWVNFWYNSNRISQIRDSFGNQTELSYAASYGVNAAKVNQLSQYQYISDSNKQIVERLGFSYSANTTTVTNLDNRKQTYQFNNIGQAVSTRYPDGSIANASYISGKGEGTNNTLTTEAWSNNKVSSADQFDRYIKNYLLNPNAESDSGYGVFRYDGTGSGTTSVDSAQSYFGAKSLKVQHTSSSDTYSGYYQTVTTTDFAGKAYTFSAYVKTQNVQAVKTGGGAGLITICYNSSGTQLQKVYSSWRVTDSTDWTRLSVSGTAPAGTAKVVVYCALQDATGTAWFDCLQLERSAVMNDVNLLEDSDFRSTTRWTAVNLDSNDTYNGGGAVVFRGNATANKFIMQTVQVGRANACLNVFGTMDGGVSADGDGRLCGVEISINYADGQTEYHNKTFNPLLVNTRQSISFSVRPKRENKVVNNIGVTYIARKNANLTALYEMMLTVDETGTTYSYDSEGNLITSADNASRNQAYSYNDAHELTQYTDTENQTYKYLYDETNKHKLLAVRSQQLGNGYQYTYDDAGNITNVKMGKISEQGVVNTEDYFFVSTSTGYDASKNHVTSQTDARGNTTTYNVNTANGMVNAVTTPVTVNGSNTTVTTGYSYNNTTRLLESVSHSSLTPSLNYTYDNKWQLTGISLGDLDYSWQATAMSAPAKGCWAA